MGSYTDKLFKKNRVNHSATKSTFVVGYDGDHVDTPAIWIASCAIIRDGVIHSYGFRSHGEIRAKLGDENPYTSSRRSDQEGFLTSSDEFLTRSEAKKLGIKTGQCQGMTRELLSSDIDKWEL